MLVSIPLGIAKAVRDGGHFDLLSSLAILVGYAIPGFLAGDLPGRDLFGSRRPGIPIFPLRGLASPDAAAYPWPHCVCWTTPGTSSCRPSQ